MNSFAPWRRDLSSFQLAGISGFDGRLSFEVKCPNGVSRIPPHLDVLLRRGDPVVAVESKCTEYLTGKKVKAAAGYLALAGKGDERTSSRWFAALSHLSEFRLLDAYQLVKHYLGLRRSYPGLPLTLVYLFWEPANADTFPLFGRHRDEIERFGELVAGDESCRFAALSYPEHWRELAATPERQAWLQSHLASLRRRYEIKI